jgi:hypothetical protein
VTTDIEQVDAAALARRLGRRLERSAARFAAEWRAVAGTPVPDGLPLVETVAEFSKHLDIALAECASEFAEQEPVEGE